MPCPAESLDRSLALQFQTDFLIRSHPPPHAGCPRGHPGPLPVLTLIAPRHSVECAGHRWQTPRTPRRFAPVKPRSCRAPAPDTARAGANQNCAPCQRRLRGEPSWFVNRFESIEPSFDGCISRPLQIEIERGDRRTIGFGIVLLIDLHPP